MLFRRVLCLMLFVWGGAGCALPESQLSADRAQQLASEVVELVRENFWDSVRGEAWAEAHADYAQRMPDGVGFADWTNHVLARLESSHTAFWTVRDPQHAGLLAIFGESLGLEVRPVEHLGADIDVQGVVRRVFSPGPAQDAGLRRGERIVSADGAAFHPRVSLRGRAESPMRFTVQRAGGVLREVVMAPRRDLLKDVWRASVEQGVRLIEQGEFRVAYVPVHSCAGVEVVDALRGVITGAGRSADALIVDLRGGFGGCTPDFVSLFDVAVPAVEFVERDGTRILFDEIWRRPMVVLIDGGSSSGKELVAHAVKRHALGTLVGQRTAGAVLGGRLFPISDGSLLYLAVVDVFVDGERLEGVGVAPDVQVADAPEGSTGWDPQLDEALAQAVRLARAVPRTEPPSAAGDER